MRRREFISVVAGAAAWPLAARAQQSNSMRRIGVLMGYAENDPEAQSRLAAFKQALVALGWSEGRNLQIDIRWGASNIVLASSAAKELVALQPELILSNTTPVTAALQRATNKIPIVFVVVSDPVGSKFVTNIARSEANITGFMNVEPFLVEKWLELLMELAPRPTRVAVMFNPETAPYAKIYLQHLESAASKLGVKTVPLAVRSENEINEAIALLGQEQGSASLR
jgi:putative ABC transport system substrate-binding protein